VFVLTLSLVGTSGSEAADYTVYPVGKNYIDVDNLNISYSVITTKTGIAVKSNTDYTFSLPFDDYQAFFYEEDLNLGLSIEGNGSTLIDSLITASNFLTLCSVDVIGYLSCTFNTGSSTSINFIGLNTNYDASYIWDISTKFQLEEGTVGTIYEAYNDGSFVDIIAPIINGGTGALPTNVNNPISVAAILSGFTATDETDGVLTIVIQSDLYTANKDTLGSYNVVFRATDLSGNYTEVTTTVMVVDTDNPIITLIGSTPHHLEYPAVYSEPGVNISDNYDTGLTASITGTVNNLVLGTYILNYNVSDSSGNAAAQISRSVVIEDTTAPIQSLNGDIIVYVEFGDNYSELGASWTDAYDTSGSSVVSGSVNVGVLGTYTVSYNITDSNGNVSSTITRSVVVRDTTSPTFTGPTSYTWNISSGYNLGYLMRFVNVSDLYDGDITDEIIIQTDTLSANTNTIGSYSVVLRATDSQGNITDHIISIEIIDDMPPTFTTTLTLLTLEYFNTMTQQDLIDYFNNN